VGKGLCATAERCFTGGLSPIAQAAAFNLKPYALSLPELLCICAWPCATWIWTTTLSLDLLAVVVVKKVLKCFESFYFF